MPFRKMVVETGFFFFFLFSNVRSKLNDTCFFLVRFHIDGGL